jgi:beta-galactosidase
MLKRLLFSALLLTAVTTSWAAEGTAPSRERLLMDHGWRFALGHATDPKKDFGHATAYFSYFAKAGHCDGESDGPMSPRFDDRGWRLLDLPHDWAVELPFDPKAGYSHGYKALGRDFPQNSIGWYRKTFRVPESDKGKRLNLEFDGIFRDSEVWVNGFYMGRESSGYNNFRYDITDYLVYGEDNTVVVRVNATMEEGWFYEGAGIYRHVWLTKTGPLHVDYDGVFVRAQVVGDKADVTVTTTVVNAPLQGKTSFTVEERVLDADGRTVASARRDSSALSGDESREVDVKLTVAHPRLWSLEDPHLYRLVTVLKAGGRELDRVETPFGVRTIHFDPDKGFFLNGKHVELKGLCVHQDHAGVGVALPDALQEYRVRRLKSLGCNAYRCAHHSPTPELLDACDRLGMLVLTENRLMGTTPMLLDRLKRQVLRERNHPCIFAWSLGNEEWGIEWKDWGARLGAVMQDLVKRLDPTRYVTAAMDGGWGVGTSTAVEVMGFNYMDHGEIDDYHTKHPKKPSFGTEDSTTGQTRGVYDSSVTGRMGPSDREGEKKGVERIWQFYTKRPFLGGAFLWTGFDYRGEEHPFEYPAISSQFGVMDTCGFPKDCARYLQCWWKDEPALFLSPHWNWKVKEGRTIDVWAYSNCPEVELFLNGKSLGKKTMQVDSHLEWDVPYAPGVLSAKAYRDGKVVVEAKQETTGAPAAIALSADRDSLQADGRDVSVVTVEAKDKDGRNVPTAANEVEFSLEGPGHIIGVGNGDPICHEPDRYFEEVSQVAIQDLRMKDGGFLGKRSEIEAKVDDSKWPVLFSGRANDGGKACTEEPKVRVVRGSFELPRLKDYSEVVLYPKSLVDAQSVYVNGHLVAERIGRDDEGKVYPLSKDILKEGVNAYAVVGKELLRRKQWEVLNKDPGYIRAVVPAGKWKRSLFNGLAQVIVQADSKPGTIVLKASSKGMATAEVEIHALEASSGPEVP